MTTRIGVIGGSGFYGMDGLTDVEERLIDTPFGNPSDAIVTGRLAGRDVAFLARHGRGHHTSPTFLNVRANIFALKTLGVDAILSFSAVGSLREHIEPTSFVVPTQIYDHTKGRASSFFGEGLVAHVSFAEPFCPSLRPALLDVAGRDAATVHDGGTYICMEGPQFSTKAESELYRTWGMDIIGMTAATEAKLAREAEMCYVTLAAVTDFDCWHPAHDDVTTEMILANLGANVAAGQRLIVEALRNFPVARDCGCRSALSASLATRPDAIPADVRKRLAPLVGKYLT
jgi:5'-methylthioadenosine phosphorylase